MRQIHDTLWVHEDQLQAGLTTLSVRMTIVRLSDGALWLHSPTALNARLQDQVSALGVVRFLIAPNNLHSLWLGQWHQAFPDADVFMAPRVADKAVRVEGGLLTGLASPPWQRDLQQLELEGAPLFNETVFLHPASQSLLVTDLIQNYRGFQAAGVGRLFSKLVMEPIGFKDICCAPPLKYPFVIQDRQRFARCISRLLGWEFERIIVAHGDIIDDDAMATLGRVCARFVRAQRG